MWKQIAIGGLVANLCLHALRIDHEENEVHRVREEPCTRDRPLRFGREMDERARRLVLAGGAAGIELEGIGEGAAPSAEMRAALTLTAPPEVLTSRTVGAYFAGKLAETLDWRLAAAVGEPGRFRLATAPL